MRRIERGRLEKGNLGPSLGTEGKVSAPYVVECPPIRFLILQQLSVVIDNSLVIFFVSRCLAEKSVLADGIGLDHSLFLCLDC